jgi:hypothetical protein
MKRDGFLTARWTIWRGCFCWGSTGSLIASQGGKSCSFNITEKAGGRKRGLISRDVHAHHASGLELVSRRRGLLSPWGYQMAEVEVPHDARV